MSINKLAALVSVLVVGCNAPASIDMEAVTAITVYNPIIGENQHGAPFTLGLLEVCLAVGDPYRDALFYNTITVDCGSHQEVITLY
jgi:hypothetical protein